MDRILGVTGLAARPMDFDFAGLAALPGQVPDVSALVPGRQGGAVRLASVLEAVRPLPEARFVTLESGDGAFAATVPLEAVADLGIIVYRVGDGPLPARQGGPVRFFIPNVKDCGIEGLDACANVKLLGRIHLSAAPGRDSRPKTRQAHEAFHRAGASPLP